ncbi:hypothetical protein BJ322DRAFT_1105899 [Thelephora terrestris]|uniref:J domain-containing protein n=1 Tax=Thelephora terrestris TaxID=56493 RepID=A0A9P6HJ05_9AGAM|nr:hypothetical protein BJ322DRAFT_1105899 [Thelephora terrestris]
MSVNSTVEIHGQNYHYSVLNLPLTASDYEIRDRYRQLSVQYHPDKQRDESAKEITSKEFLRIQKAYQGMSIFVSCQIHFSGEDGLQIELPEGLNERSVEEIKSELVLVKRNVEARKLEQIVRPSNRLSLAVDATSLFQRDHDHPSDSRLGDALDRIRGVNLLNVGLRHNHVISDKTRVSLSSAIALSSGPGGESGSGQTDIVGSVRHFYSPRLNFELSTPLLARPGLTCKANYTDGASTIQAETRITAWTLFTGKGVVPPWSLTYSRRLFPNSGIQGELTLDALSASPSLLVNAVFPKRFDYTPKANSEEDRFDDGPSTRLLSGYTLAKGTSFYSLGVSLSGLMSGIQSEFGVVFNKLALDMRIGGVYGFLGLSYWIAGAWTSSDQRAAVGANINSSTEGVALTIDLRYQGQSLRLPIVLSTDPEPQLAFYTSIVPTIALLLGYHLVYEPRQHRRRVAYKQRLQREVENSPEYREALEIERRVLRDVARRHMDAERNVDGEDWFLLLDVETLRPDRGPLILGLVIEKAVYGCSLREAKELVIDVTTAVRALVNKSQLYIPGRQTKCGLQGFCDPAPKLPKALKIWYCFRGRRHYAEVEDSFPVVIPLEDHLVE